MTTRERIIWKKTMLRANEARPDRLKVEVPKGFRVNGAWGRAAKTFAERLHKSYGLRPSSRLTLRLRNQIRRYRPETYGKLGREVWLAAGHAGSYNKMPLLPTDWESKEAIRVVNELLAEGKRRGAKDVHLVPHKYDLGASVNYILAKASKGAFCWELHYNAGPASARGWVTAYSRGNQTSLAMAKRIAKEVKEAGFPLWSNGIIASATIAGWNGWSDIGWHRAPNAAGLVPNLLEMGFGTSRYDTWWWRTKRKRIELVSAMADALWPPK